MQITRGAAQGMTELTADSDHAAYLVGDAAGRFAVGIVEAGRRIEKTPTERLVQGSEVVGGVFGDLIADPGQNRQKRRLDDQ